MKVEIEIPSSLKGIKLKQYQDYLRLLKEVKDPKKQQLKAVEILCGFTEEATSKIRFNDISKIIDELNELFNQEVDLIRTFKLGGVEFGFIPNLEEITLGEYVDLDSYLGDWDIIHKAMAVLYRPIKVKKRSWFNRKEDQYIIEPYTGTKEYAELMKHMPLEVALGAYFFFVILRAELLKNTENYLVQQATNLATSLTRLASSDKNGAGIAQYINSLTQTLEESKK
jgi:hypothetical protein